MFEVTEKASEMLKESLDYKEKIPHVRIILSQGG